MRTKVLLLILFSVIGLTSITAQKKNYKITLTGTVLGVNNEPVVNAIVMVDGKNTSSMTDSKGIYKIRVKQDAKTIGIVSFAYGMIEEPIDGRVEYNFNYGKSTAQQTDQAGSPGDEGVNAGYNYLKKKDNTTPMKKINGTDKKYASYSSVYEMITREVSGVKVGSSGIIIQDSKDFFGNVPALLIVDGVPVNSFDGIPPSSVESIVVLKGSSAAIYGSRGYGGAVVITTKKENQ